MTSFHPCKTIYAWKPGLSDAKAFPVERSEPIGAFHRAEAGFPVADKETRLTDPNLPPNLSVYRQASFAGRHDLFPALSILSPR